MDVINPYLADGLVDGLTNVQNLCWLTIMWVFYAIK
jgi:hypothetical protein